MHFLRLLRIFIPLLLVAAIVAGIVVVLTSRNELQSSRREVEDTWTPLRAISTGATRRSRLPTSAVKTVPGPLHAISTKVTSAYTDWGRLEQKNGSVSSEVNAANNLESLGRRLVLAALAAPRLTGRTTGAGRDYGVRGPEAADGRGSIQQRGRPLRERAQPARTEPGRPHPRLQGDPGLRPTSP